MELDERNTGTIHALLERLANERLPRLISIKERVEQGECLAEVDIDFLERSLNDANENAHLYKGFPEYHDIAGKVVAIYHDITARALANEKSSQL